MCFFCFSSDPLSSEEVQQGKYAAAYGQFIYETNKFDVTLCQAPCAEPCCWFGSMACCCCAQIMMRHKVLNHVHPNSGWQDYECCQGMYGGCCCLQPGQCCDKTFPRTCMCLEVVFCPGPAVSATSLILRRHYRLGLDQDDVRLIRCNNCLFCMSVILSCLTICIDNETLDCAAHCANVTSDIVFCCTSGCMMAQAYHECKVREAPTANRMQR